MLQYTMRPKRAERSRLHGLATLFCLLPLACYSWASASPAAQSRRNPDYRLEEHMLEFSIQSDATQYVHTMWPCEDPVEMALFYCTHVTFADMPANYCDALQASFTSRYEMVKKRNGGLNHDCSRLKDYKQHFHPKMQLAHHEANAVIHAMHAFKPPAKVLIWGAGYDSELWCKMNEGGRTVILEQNKEFRELIQPLVPNCPIYLVNYTTLVPQGVAVSLTEEQMFLLRLPKEVLDTKWDVILVDGPTGYDEEQPGRMQSIYMSSLLVHEDSVVCVDDSTRFIEGFYGLTYLGRTFSSSVVLKGTDMMCYLTP